VDYKDALLVIGGRSIRTGRMTNGVDCPATKSNPYLVYLPGQGGYGGALEMRELGDAYLAIANHLDQLNKDLLDV